MILDKNLMLTIDGGLDIGAGADTYLGSGIVDTELAGLTIGDPMFVDIIVTEAPVAATSVTINIISATTDALGGTVTTEWSKVFLNANYSTQLALNQKYEVTLPTKLTGRYLGIQIVAAGTTSAGMFRAYLHSDPMIQRAIT